MIIVCMLFSLLGNVIFSADVERDLDSEAKTVRSFDLPAKWEGVCKESKDQWRARNADLFGLKECFFEQDGFCDILTLRNASETLVFTIDRSVHVANNGELCRVLVRSKGAEQGCGRVEVLRQSDDERGKIKCIYPDGESRTKSFFREGATTPPQVPCCYNFGESKLIVRCFIYDNVTKKERCFLLFKINYEDFSNILILKGTSSVAAGAFGSYSGYHFGAFVSMLRCEDPVASLFRRGW